MSQFGSENPQNGKLNIFAAFKRKSMKHHVECGVRISIDENDVQDLKEVLGEDKSTMYEPGTLSRCVVCEDICVEGELAIEEVLFIPNKNDPASDNLNRFRVYLPRVCCHECASDYAQRHSTHTTPPVAINLRSIGTAYKEYIESKSNESKSVGNESTKIAEEDDPNNENQSVAPISEAERDPFEDGFLICTQLVKTGGADQGGLQVGDVFVEFAHYSKKRFPGLKSIANLVRRSAGKEIPVVVWRKLEINTLKDENGSGRTVFQKLALKLKPLQSHDADGGGVLGAVMNTYPLPEMKN